MELNWSTFILEIINFLVLVWLLAYFFYRPVMNVIARRREEIQSKLDEAGEKREEAESLKTQYENRLAEWEDEKASARAELDKEIEEERKRRMEELRDSLEQERKREEVLARRRIQSEIRDNEKRAVRQSLSFISRLLKRLAGPELEGSIVQLVTEQLENLDEDQRTLISKAHAADKGVTVTSAYPLAEKHREAIARALSAVVEEPKCEFQEDPGVIAGVKICIGSWLLQATLQDEFKYFSEAGHDSL